MRTIKSNLVVHNRQLVAWNC